MILVDALQPADLERPELAPRIHALGQRSVRFTRAAAYPGSSATRAALLSGRYGRRTGFGGGSEPDLTTWELPLDELILPEVLARSAEHPWSTAAVGSWHLATPRSPHAFDHPNLQGFDHFAGTLADRQGIAGQPDALSVDKTTNGTPQRVRRYTSTEAAEDAVRQLTSLQDPWLLYVALRALRGPHGAAEGAAREPLRHGWLRATDASIGAMLDAVPRPDQTIVVLVGTAHSFDDPSAALVFSGPGLARGASAALLHVVDVLPTVAELVGVDEDTGSRDGVSVAHLLRDPGAPGVREVVYTERFAPVGVSPWRAGPYDIDDVAVHDGRHRLSRVGGTWRFEDRDAGAPPPPGESPRRVLRRALKHVLAPR